MPTKKTEWCGHEFVVLPNEGETSLRLDCGSGHVPQFLAWSGGDGAEVLQAAEEKLNKVQEILERNDCPLTEGLVARLASHAWTTMQTSELIVVTDYRSGKESQVANEKSGGVTGIARPCSTDADVSGFRTNDVTEYDETEEKTTLQLQDVFTFAYRLDVGYHPTPSIRYHVKHNSNVVNLLCRGYSVRCYRTLFQGAAGLERRYEFGFSVRDAVHPALYRALQQQGISGPGVVSKES